MSNASELKGHCAVFHIQRLLTPGHRIVPVAMCCNWERERAMEKIDGTNGTYETYKTYGIRRFFIRPIGLIGLIGPILFSTPTLAQTTASPVQSAIGTACSGKANSADFDAIAQCNGATMQRAPIQVGQLMAPPYATTTCDANKKGMIQWNGTDFQGCNGTAWVAGFKDPAVLNTPNAFSFTNVTGAFMGVVVKSNAVTITGFTGNVVGVCDTGCIAIYRNGAKIGPVASFLPNDTIAIEQIASSSANTTTTAYVRVGNTLSGAWTVQTTNVSGMPQPFAFNDVTGVTLDSPITSNAVTLMGGFTGSLTATCSGCTAIARNGTWGGTSVSGFTSGNTIAIRQQSSNSVNTTTQATVTVGTTSSSPWKVTTNPTTDPCDGAPTVGTVCADGTLYAGLTPDGNVKMFTTRCDVGMTFDTGMGICTGTRTTMAWQTGAAGTGILTGAISGTTGQTNTTLLVNLGTGLPGPYIAARYCDDLTAHGRTDWYLPAVSELQVMFDGALGQNSAFSGLELKNMWTSTEYGSDDPNRVRTGYLGGAYTTADKAGSVRFRCVRKE